MKYYTAGNSCCNLTSGNGGTGNTTEGQYFEADFTNAITVNIPQIVHLIASTPVVTVYKKLGEDVIGEILGDLQILANGDVTVSFDTPQTGVIVLIGKIGGIATTGVKAYTFISEPNANNDSSEGYLVGDRAIYGGNEYVLISNNVGAAVWKLTTGTDMATLNLDAFERLRVSEPVSIFGAQLTYGLQPLVYEPITSGTGATITHDATNRCALLTLASTGVGGQTIFQSFEHIRYQEGKSQQILISFNFKESVAGVRKFVGYSDGTNGIEFTSINGIHSFRILSNTAEGNETVNQADWNLDQFSGFDVSKTQLLVIDFQALYVGKVRIGFEIDRKLTYCHEFDHANLAANPYIASANLPIRAGQTVESGTRSTTMNFICCNVSSEGGVDNPYGVPNNINANVTAVNGVRTHILSVRPKTTFNGLTNRTKIIETELEVTVTGTSPVLWEMCIGQAISGTTTFSDVNSTNSSIEYNTAGTVSGNPTLVIDRGYVIATNQTKGSQTRLITVKIPITLDAAGLQRLNGTISIVVTGVGGNSNTFCVFKWLEIY